MRENEKYEIIKKLIDTNGNKQTAALKIGCTKRTINRLIAGSTGSLVGAGSVKGISSIDEDNRFLNSYIKSFLCVSA